MASSSFADPHPSAPPAHSSNSPSRGDAAPVGHTGAADQVLGWLLVGVANALVTWLGNDMAAGGTHLLLQNAYDLGHALALGLLCWPVAWAWRRWFPGRWTPARWPLSRWGPARVWLGYLGLGIAATVLAQWIVQPDMRSLAGRVADAGSWAAVSATLAALVALVVPASAWLGGRLTRWLGPHPVWTLALILAMGHQLVLNHLYPGLHTYATWCAALMGAASFQKLLSRQPATPPRRGWRAAIAAALGRPWIRAALGALALAAAAAALLIPMPPVVRMRMLQIPGSLVAQWSHLVPGRNGALLPQQVGVRPGALALPPRPATSRAELAWLPNQPIVLLITVDALRADVIDKHPEQLPELARLQREGVAFPHAWSASPSTTPSVASLFSGRYVSGLRWGPRKVGRRMDRSPHADPTPRVAELLDQKRVHTAVATHMPGMRASFGLTKGFRDELKARRAGAEVAAAWKGWISNHHQQASLSYVHFIDPHNPYDLGGTHGTPFERYLREVAIVDKALAGMRRHLASLGAGDRVILVLSADHGEAFGEHGSRYHGSTVYEEQVRIPLIIHHPALQPRTVTAQVSLVDIAPTLLDIFGVDAPGSYAGASLLPVLQGKPVRRDGPIVVDAKNYTAMVFDDWTKLVLHKSGAVALYDLRADPGEHHNVIEQHPRAAQHLRTFRDQIRARGLRPFRWARPR